MLSCLTSGLHSIRSGNGLIPLMLVSVEFSVKLFFGLAFSL